MHMCPVNDTGQSTLSLLRVGCVTARGTSWVRSRRLCDHSRRVHTGLHCCLYNHLIAQILHLLQNPLVQHIRMRSAAALALCLAVVGLAQFAQVRTPHL
jgi:hypothetical protein